MPSAKDEFLQEIKNESPVMDDQAFNELLDKKDPPKTEEVKPKEETITIDGEEVPNTRRYRRLQEKYQKERESTIALSERLKVLSELDKFAKENPEVDPTEIKVFGTDDQGKLLKSYFDKRFQQVKSEAEQAALERIEAEQAAISEEEAKNSEFIDDAFDNIEDRYNIDLSGKTKASRDFRNGFIDFVEEISPKDSSGEIIEYADFESAFETYAKLAERNKPREVSDRQKELASRSMTHSGAPVTETPKGPITFKTVGRVLDQLRGQN